MNILPHKSWHVRTKKNIARVRKDEAEAAEKEKEKQRRIQLAAQESRTSFLRTRASQRVEETGEELPIPLAQVANLTQGDGHINFFQDLEDGMKLNSEVNKEHEEEKKKEKEDYEKKIGYLVYLGQDSLGQAKDRPWYETKSVARPSVLETKSNDSSTLDTDQMKLAKFKEFEDPLKDIRKYLNSPGVTKTKEALSDSKRKRKSEYTPAVSSELKKKKKEHKSHKSTKKRKSKKEKKRSRKRNDSEYDSSSSGVTDEIDSEDEKKKKLEKLRNERLEREREERRKAEKLLAMLRGDTISEAPTPARQPDKYTPHPMKQKYNSQFNPHLARQNYDD